MKSKLKRSAVKGLIAFAITAILSVSTGVLNASSLVDYSTPIVEQKNQRVVNRIEILPLEPGNDTSYTRIYLNMKNNVSLSAGQIKYFTYTPESDYYFVIETYGDCDTKIQVSDTASGTIIDDDSGVGLNAKVEFRGVQGQPIYISTKLYNSNLTGNYSIQLRKQRISMFAYDDDDGNSTIPDLSTPFNKFSPIFDAIKYENKSSSDALANDDRDLAKLNSEIMFFSGHGYKNDANNKGFGVAFKTGGITTNTYINMDRTKVAMWSACYSANSTNSENLSIAEYSVNCGAKSAVGFTESVTFSSSKTFTNRFFTKLSEGATVKAAATHGASGLFWPWDNGKKYVIFGNENLTVTSPTTSISTFSLTKVNRNILNELGSNVIVVNMDQTTKRYYETIEGIMSNSFVDITFDNDSIVDVKDYRKNIDTYLPINNLFINQLAANSIVIGNETYTLDEECSRNVVYALVNNVMTPIEIITARYSHNDIVIEEPTCVNLSNGQKIDYSQINSL